jgi:hypothetical protein
MRSGATAVVKTRTAAALLGCGWMLSVAFASALWAGDARLIEGDGPARVVVQATDATVDEVMAVLAGRFQFTVERSAPAAQPLRLSGRFEGALDEVLDRVLRHQGHMLVRSADATAGISRVVLIEAKGAAPAPAGASTSDLSSPIAALKARMQLPERKEAGR